MLALCRLEVAQLRRGGPDELHLRARFETGVGERGTVWGRLLAFENELLVLCADRCELLEANVKVSKCGVRQKRNRVCVATISDREI